MVMRDGSASNESSEMAEALMKYETIDAHQIDDIMDGKAPRQPKGWGDNDSGSGSSGERKKEETILIRTSLES